MVTTRLNITIIVIGILVERLLPKQLPVPVYLLVQCCHVGLWGLLHDHSFLLVFVGICLHMRGIGVQYLSADQSFCDCLAKYLVENLLGYIVIPEPPAPVPRRRAASTGPARGRR